MLVGLVAEGVSDVTVLRNLLKGWLGLDRYQVIALRPDLQEDETDRCARLAVMAPAKYSNWELVLDTCKGQSLIRAFLDANSEDSTFVVVQIDTDWLDHKNSPLQRPAKSSADYAQTVRKLVVDHLSSLLGDLTARTRFAVAVEEVEAWLLCLHDSKNPDTCKSADPKAKLERVHKTKAPSPDTEKRYAEFSADFRRRKSIEAVWDRNVSLKAFLQSLPPADEPA